MITKTITITPSVLEYQGDPIGKDFVFVLLLNGQNYLYRSFHQKLTHGKSISIIGRSLGLHLSYEETERQVHIPVAVMAAELDAVQVRNKSQFLGADQTDFGLNASVVSFEFTEGYTYPHTFQVELPVAVQGDFWAEKGREKNKTAQLILRMDVEANWDTAQMELGERIVMEYQAGRRSFNGDHLQQINLANAVLPGVDFGEANLLWAHFENADLYGSDFILAILRGANLRAAHLQKARLSEANLTEAVLDDANLRFADLSYALINGSWIDCKAQYADFTGAQVDSSNFYRADLDGAIFRNARLDYVDFREANLRLADFTGAQIGKINYEGANTEGAIALESVPSTNFDPIDPFEGKSEEFRRGYQEGYSRGYAHAIGQEKYDEYAWEVSLTDHFPGYTTDFAAGYQAGFMQTYRESWADAGNELAHE